MPPKPSPTGRSSITFTFGVVVIAVGAISLIAGLAGHGFAAPGVPTVITYSNIAVAALELALGAGVMRGRAGAWAFAVSVAFTMLIIDLLGTPQLLRAGASGQLGLALVAIRTGYGIGLIVYQDEFRGPKPT
jgi:hypothetical protein